MFKLLLWPARIITLVLILTAIVTIVGMQWTDSQSINVAAILMAMASLSAVGLAILEWHFF